MTVCDVDQDMTAADTLEKLLTNRRSCRAFLPEQLPPETVRRALDIARRTASWCNTQPWNLVVTAGDATDRFRDALVAHATGRIAAGQFGPESDFPFPEPYQATYKTRQRDTARQLYEAIGVEWGDRAASAKAAFENFRLFGAPHFMLVTTPRHIGAYGAVDCGAYVTSFLLAAEALGFGAIAQAAIAVHSGFVRDYFGVSDEHMVICGISFGLNDASHRANSFYTARADISEGVTFFEG